MSKSWFDLSEQEQNNLVFQYLRCKSWNASLPPWDGKPTGKYVGKKDAGKPSYRLEKERGYVT